MVFDCQSCGACCAAFRVSFYWTEALVNHIPDALVEQVSAVHGCMAGTNQAAPHCAALVGEVGARVSCRIYASRPSPCREVTPGDARCLTARARHGLVGDAQG